MVPTAEIVVTGNEILSGRTLDSNSNWLCKVITGLGGEVRRVTQVKDDLTAISGALRSACETNASAVFTLGGLGPTQDDMTLKAVAMTTGRPLEVNTHALEIVSARYRYFASVGAVEDASLTPSREKMACLPTGAIALDNQVGGAPACVLELDNQRIISLPGVPSELKWIVQNPLSEYFSSMFGVASYLEVTHLADCADESILAPLISNVSKLNPGVYLKSRPKRFGSDVRFRVTLTSRGDSYEQVHQNIEKATSTLAHVLADAGIRLERGSI